MSKRDAANALVKSFFEKHPADAARTLETMPEEEARFVLLKLSHEAAAQAVEFLNPHAAALIFEDLPPEQVKNLLESVSPKRVTDILLDLQPEKREEFLRLLDPSQGRVVSALLKYPPETAGGIMSPGVTALNQDLHVGEAIRTIRTLGKKKTLYYVYVTDTENHLKGVLGMRDLILADPQTPLSAITRGVVSVPAHLDREEVVHLASKHHYLTIPVVDDEQRILGMIHSEDLIEAAAEEASEDIQKMFGAGGDEGPLSSIGFSVRKRLPWLHVNLATAFLAAAVVGLFQNTIARITALAVFLPVVAGQGGNAGAQTLAVVIRGLALGEIDRAVVKKIFLKEAGLGLVNGLVVGLVTAGIGYFLEGNFYFGLVIGLAMAANMLVACVSGAAIPLVMKAVGFDPAQSSSIILTTVTDVVGFFSFLGLATLFQHLLI